MWTASLHVPALVNQRPRRWSRWANRAPSAIGSSGSAAYRRSVRGPCTCEGRGPHHRGGLLRPAFRVQPEQRDGRPADFQAQPSLSVTDPASVAEV